MKARTYVGIALCAAISGAVARAAVAKPSKAEQKFIDTHIDAVRRTHNKYGIRVSVFFGVIAAEVGLYDLVWKEKDANGKEVTRHSWWHATITNNYFNLANGTKPSAKKEGMICNSSICFQKFADLEEAAIMFAETVCGYAWTDKKKPNPYHAAYSYVRSVDSDPSKFDLKKWVDLIGPVYEPEKPEWAATVKKSIERMELEDDYDLDNFIVCPPRAAPAASTAAKAEGDAGADSGGDSGGGDSAGDSAGDSGSGDSSGADSAGDSAKDSNDTSAGTDDNSASDSAGD